MTPAMRMVIEQMLRPPIDSAARSLYLEGKALELISLKLWQQSRADTACFKLRLKSDDKQKLLQAKRILLARMANPPSIQELAHLAGMNDHKLKIGFRQVFGDTVYRTLKAARMEKARQLLRETRHSVLHVANEVGYENPSHFAAAFRDRFGMSPSAYVATIAGQEGDGGHCLPPATT